MRSVFHTAWFITVVISLNSCNKSEVYEQRAKTLDSLGGAVNAVVRELESIDTILLQKSVTRFNWYNAFIQQNVNDTLSKEEADQLRHFYTSGKSLERFSMNRKTILARAALMNSQLLKLKQDLKKKSLSADQLSIHTLYEKKRAAELIDLGYQQQKIFHSGIEGFKNSLKAVELLMRRRNKGELPTVVKDTVTL